MPIFMYAYCLLPENPSFLSFHRQGWKGNVYSGPKLQFYSGFYSCVPGNRAGRIPDIGNSKVRLLPDVFHVVSLPAMNKQILRLALPNILSNISVPLLSTADIYFMSLLSTEHLGAVGIATMIFNFLYWNFGFLRMGTTGLTAQAYGAGDSAYQGHILWRGVALALLLSAVLLVLAPWLIDPLAHLMNVQGELRPLMSEYYLVGLAGIPATLLLFTMKGWLFGMQNALYPLWITLIVNLVNIGLSYVLVVHGGYGIKGVAIGTVAAQWVGVATGAGMLMTRYGIRWSGWTTWREWMVWQKMREFMRFNGHLFLRTLALSIVFGIVYARGAAFGPELLAVNVVLLQMLNWMSYGIDGFAYAAESLVGRFMGAGAFPALRKAIWGTFAWGLALALLFSMVYGLAGKNLMGWLLKEPEAFDLGLQYLPWMVAMPLLGIWSYMWDGVFAGLTAARALRDAMLAAFVGFILVLWLATPIWQNHGLWLALSVFLVIRGVWQSMQYRRHNQKWSGAEGSVSGEMH
jgi:multidrug resistance protein, MATE family